MSAASARVAPAVTDLRRVAYVCTDPGIGVFGTKGAAVHAQAILRVLRRAGVEVHLICARTDGPPPADLADVVVHALPAVPKGEAAVRERAAQRSDAAVADVLTRLAADGPLDLVYERYALWGRTATAWARRHGVPSLLEVNAPLPVEQRTHRTLVHEAEALSVARAALSAADAACCVSDGVADWASEVAPAARVRVVPNGVDTRRIVPGTRPVAGSRGPFTVGFVGTLKPWHGVEQLLAAVTLLRADADGDDVRLLVVGDGPQAGAIDGLAAHLGISDAVERTGAVSPEQIPALLRRMDVATAPYPDGGQGFYFSPLKVYEYLAAGLPVVASAVGEIPSLLDGGRWGELVAPGDAGALATAIGRLRADVERRRTIRDAGPLHARRHDWDQVLATALAALPATHPTTRETADAAH